MILYNYNNNGKKIMDNFNYVHQCNYLIFKRKWYY